MKHVSIWLLAATLCMTGGVAAAKDFLLTISGDEDSILSGKLVLTRMDGSRIERRLSDLRPGQLYFEGRAILLTLRIERSSVPVQAELFRGPSRVSQAMADGAGGVMSLSAVR